MDVTTRITADALSGELGKPLVVDNRVGAGGNIAADVVAKAPPDGYTLLQSSNALAISPGIYSKLPFDVLKDFEPVSEVTTTFLVMVVHPSVPAKTLAGIHRLRQDESRCRLRIGRRRHHHASRGGAVRARDRD